MNVMSKERDAKRQFVIDLIKSMTKEKCIDEETKEERFYFKAEVERLASVFHHEPLSTIEMWAHKARIEGRL